MVRICGAAAAVVAATVAAASAATTNRVIVVGLCVAVATAARRHTVADQFAGHHILAASRRHVFLGAGHKLILGAVALLCRPNDGREALLLVAVLQIEAILGRHLILDFICDLLSLLFGISEGHMEESFRLDHICKSIARVHSLVVLCVFPLDLHRVPGQRVIERRLHAVDRLVLVEHLVRVPAVRIAVQLQADVIAVRAVPRLQLLLLHAAARTGGAVAALRDRRIGRQCVARRIVQVDVLRHNADNVAGLEDQTVHHRVDGNAGRGQRTGAVTVAGSVVMMPIAGGAVVRQLGGIDDAMGHFERNLRAEKRKRLSDGRRVQQLHNPHTRSNRSPSRPYLKVWRERTVDALVDDAGLRVHLDDVAHVHCGRMHKVCIAVDALDVGRAAAATARRGDRNPTITISEFRVHKIDMHTHANTSTHSTALREDSVHAECRPPKIRQNKNRLTHSLGGSGRALPRESIPRITSVCMCSRE